MADARMHMSIDDMDDEAYNGYIESMRREEYPMLQGSLYLDHAGSTLCSRRLLDRFHADMVSTLYGNPHSSSQSSMRTADAIDAARMQLLAFLKAKPEEFDVVFTANATAAIKLVADAFRDQDSGFHYAYHEQSHTSLVGVREVARSDICFVHEAQAEKWLEQKCESSDRCPNLIAFPAQSSLDGSRLPIDWIAGLRNGTADSSKTSTYVLLDAASWSATSPLLLRTSSTAPDFIALSLYKIFGFPDLGALIVRKDSSRILSSRRYFGGGTVDMVVTAEQKAYPRHVMKSIAPHDFLEDGTLPYHNIKALTLAMDTHAELFQSMDRVARHTQYLSRRLHNAIAALRHANGRPAVEVYRLGGRDHSDGAHGPLVAFNLKDEQDRWLSVVEFEKLAFANNINVRTGSMCNPGGSSRHLGLSPEDLQKNFEAGHRCGGDHDILNGKPTGMIRVSLGAMSTISDVDAFVGFIKEYFVTTTGVTEAEGAKVGSVQHLRVENLTIYPIKSCGAYHIPAGQSWIVDAGGLAWDRQWCIVHAVTGKVLNQKRYPKMVLLRPELDLEHMTMRIHSVDSRSGDAVQIDVPMTPPSLDSSHAKGADAHIVANGCGEQRGLFLHDVPALNAFLSDRIGVPCRLAQFSSESCMVSQRHAKPWSHTPLRTTSAFANESPILAVSRTSLDKLNKTIAASEGKIASSAVFRANIVLAPPAGCTAAPYCEDDWENLLIGDHLLDVLGGCRRCQMVCIDQTTGLKDAEPFATLAKTRRRDGKVLFGVHSAMRLPASDGASPVARISVGDMAVAHLRMR